MTDAALLNATELMALLGISKATFHRHKAQYRRLFDVRQPVGMRRYSRLKVEQYLRGESIVAFGAGSRRVS